MESGIMSFSLSYLGPKGSLSDNMLPECQVAVFRFQASGRGATKHLNAMSLTLHQLLVGVAFQPRNKIALNSSSFHRGWKAAPTETTPSLKRMTWY